MTEILTLVSGLATLGFACYLLYLTSEPLENTGGQLGKLLRLPDEVIASTFQALATSGPEIAMAIIAATAFINNSTWQALQQGEKASSGTLNMAFSNMDNLLGIGAVAIIFMIMKQQINPNDKVPRNPSMLLGLVFCVITTGLLTVFLYDKQLTPLEGGIMLSIGVVYIIGQFFIPKLLLKHFPTFYNKNTPKEIPEKTKPTTYIKQLATTTFKYVALVFALWLFVERCLAATFDIGLLPFVSVGGVLLALTSYVSSFPEFMLSYRYVKLQKRDALLSMLFGSNVIDLAFSGFRSVYTNTTTEVFTTGLHNELLIAYIATLPILATLLLILLLTNKLKWKYAKPGVVFYIVYILSGLILL